VVILDKVCDLVPYDPKDYDPLPVPPGLPKVCGTYIDYVGGSDLFIEGMSPEEVGKEMGFIGRDSLAVIAAQGWKGVCASCGVWWESAGTAHEQWRLPDCEKGKLKTRFDCPCRHPLDYQPIKAVNGCGNQGKVSR